VFEVKITRFHVNAFVIDSHGLALEDNQYDVLLVFTLLQSRGIAKPTGPKNMAVHQVGEAMIAPTPTIRS
jgi:hypothetical protein